MSRMMQAAQWLGQQLGQAGGRHINYLQGTTLLAVTATPADHEYTVEGENGFTTQLSLVDWTIRSKAFREAGIEPRPGDRIEEVLFSSVVAYEVLPAGSLPCYSWLDTAGVLLLVRTKRIG